MFRKVALMLILLSAGILARAFEVPRLASRVNDYAGMLDQPTARDINALLDTYEKQIINQIFQLTGPGIGDAEGIEEYSIKVAESWKAGHKGTDNGAILVVAKNERKVRIEVGYGLEGSLTDLASSRIIRNVIVPRFKQGDFSGGIKAGVGGIIAAIGDKNFQAPAGFELEQAVPQKNWDTSRGRGGWIMLPIIIAAFVLFVLSIFGRVFRGLGLGTLFGGIAYIIFGLGFFILIAAVLGFIFGLSSGGTRGTRGGGFSSWGGLGGGIGGGGFGGGGFGGGGGGGFGGGGGSGSW